MEKIDFVVAWVDDSDPVWRAKRDKYLKKDHPNESIVNDIRDIRYRDWGLLKYWFRSVEKYAPWVNQIFFVTDHQIPEWLNLNADKIRVVFHEDFIPAQYLPTFSSHAIEVFFHRIPDLSENFVYFNDDMYLTDYVKASDFFFHGKPRALGILNIKTFNVSETMGFTQLVDTAVINKYFEKRKVIKKNLFKWFNLNYGLSVFRTILLLPWKEIPDFYLNHLPTNMKKSTYEIVWKMEKELLEKSASHRFREYTDLNQWVFCFWQICSGNFVPQKKNIGKAFCVGDDIQVEHEVCNIIEKRKYKMICIGEGNSIEGVEKASKHISEMFEKILPKKSCFEI